MDEYRPKNNGFLFIVAILGIVSTLSAVSVSLGCSRADQSTKTPFLEPTPTFRPLPRLRLNRLDAIDRVQKSLRGTICANLVNSPDWASGRLGWDEDPSGRYFGVWQQATPGGYDPEWLVDGITGKVKDLSGCR